MGSLSRTTRTLIAGLSAGLFYILSNASAVMAMNTLTTVHCRSTMFFLSCDYAAPEQWRSGVLEILASAAFIALGASWLWLRKTLVYPFIVVMTLFLLMAAGYDALFANPILHEAKIINDTMNVLGFVIFASFLLTFSIVEESVVSLVRAVASIVVSFGAKIYAMCVFAAIQPLVMGATELFLLFFLYAFGVFSMHLMTLGSLVAAGRGIARKPAEHANAAPPSTRNQAVDGLRGIAILLMVVYHYVPTDFFSFSLGKPINSILFVVAGYFFASTILNSASAIEQPFGLRARNISLILLSRHLRIWPVVAIIVILYMIVGLVDRGPLTQQIFEMWPYYLAYLGFVPRLIYEDQTFPPHLWVISAQEVLVFLCCAAAGIFGMKQVRRNLWVVVGLGIALRFIATALFMPAAPSLALETPLSVLDPVALGMLVRFELDRRGAAFQLRHLLILAFTCTALLWIFLPNWNAVYFTLVPFMVALGVCFVMVLGTDEIRGVRIAGAWLANPFLVTVGRMSLSAFLLHPLVNTCVRLLYAHYVGQQMAWWLLLAIGPVLSFAAAWVFWRWIEEPLRQRKPKWFAETRIRRLQPALTAQEFQTRQVPFSDRRVSAP